MEFRTWEMTARRGKPVSDSASKIPVETRYNKSLQRTLTLHPARTSTWHSPARTARTSTWHSQNISAKAPPGRTSTWHSQNISAKAPPTLFIHAMNDPVDNVRHAMAYALALNNAGARTSTWHSQNIHLAQPEDQRESAEPEHQPGTARTSARKRRQRSSSTP